MAGGELDVNAFLEKLRGIADSWDSAHSELETMRITATSDDGCATAVSDSGGAVIHLSISGDLRSRGRQAVAASLLQAAGRAVTEANHRRAALVSESVALAVDARAVEARTFGAQAAVAGAASAHDDGRLND